MSRTDIANPQITGRADRRQPWDVVISEDPDNGATVIDRKQMIVPLGEGERQKAIRWHETLHAAHSPGGAPPSLGHRMAEEVRIDVLAHIGGLACETRHDGAEAKELTVATAPLDCVAWYWQSALTLGDYAAAAKGRIKARASAPPELQRALLLTARRMGSYKKEAVGWVAKLIADPTPATRLAAAQWWDDERTKANKGGAKSEAQQQFEHGLITEAELRKAEPGSGTRRVSAKPRPGCSARLDGDSIVVIRGDNPRMPLSDATYKKRHQVRETILQPAELQRYRAQLDAKQEQARAAQTSRKFVPARSGVKGATPTLPKHLPPLPEFDQASTGYHRSMLHNHLQHAYGTAVKLRRGVRAEGSTVIRPERWYAGDRRVFSARRLGGSMAIDISGSMGWDWDKLAAAIAEMPGLTIIVHGQRQTYTKSGGYAEVPALCLIADKGRYTAPTLRKCGMGGSNGSDIEALQWLAQQRAPRIWLSDAGVCDGLIDRWLSEKGKAAAREQVLRIARTADIVRVETVPDALALCRHQALSPRRAIRARLSPDRFLQGYLSK